MGGGLGGMQRVRSTRATQGYGGGADDPLGFVGRRLWRHWPSENPPWVEGFLQQWDPETDFYTILYDPHTRDSTEELYSFGPNPPTEVRVCGLV